MSNHVSHEYLGILGKMLTNTEQAYTLPSRQIPLSKCISGQIKNQRFAIYDLPIQVSKLKLQVWLLWQVCVTVLIFSRCHRESESRLRTGSCNGGDNK